MTNTNLGQVLAAVATPVGIDYRPDVKRLVEHCNWLLANGCSGLAPLGTTGEANSFGLSDRISLIADMAEAGLPMNKCIVGIGSAALEDAARVAQTALDAGSRGLLLLPPFYYKLPSEDGLFRFFAALAERIADRQPRIYLYHFPAMSAVPVTLTLTARLRTEFPGLFVGAKDSSGELETSLGFVDAFPDFEVFTGHETLAPQLVAGGGAGCISAVANLSAPLIARRLAMAPGEFSRRLDRQLSGVRTLVSAHGVISGVKAVLAEFRRDAEWLRTVPPTLALAQQQAAHLANQIDDIAELRTLHHRNVSAK